MAKLSVAVLKAYRLKDTSTLGKQSLYLRLVAGSVVKTTDVHTDAGTDCSLGEIFSVDIPPSVDSVQVEVIAKHALTGDNLIGTATVILEDLRDSGGDVIRLPVMSKKGRMHGEIEVTGSVADGATPSAPKAPTPGTAAATPAGAYSTQQQPAYPSQQQQQRQQPYPGMYPPPPAAGAYPPYGQQRVQSPSCNPYAYWQPPQQQQLYPGNYAPPAAAAAYPYAYPPTASAVYPPPAAAVPAGYPTPAAAAAPAAVTGSGTAATTGTGRGSGMMGTALAAGAGALGGAVVGNAIADAVFDHHGGYGGGWGGPGYYDGGDTVIVNNNYDTTNIVNDTTDVYNDTDKYVDDAAVGDGWVDMDNGGNDSFAGGDFF